MTRLRGIMSGRCSIALCALIVGTTTLGAQGVGTRPPGAPPGTTTPAVPPKTTPAVTTPAANQQPAGQTGTLRDRIVRPVGESTPAQARALAGTTVGATAGSSAAAPWRVKLVPGNLPFRVGQCSPVSMELLDAAGKDTPRAPTGWRVSIADFDMNVTTTSGASVVGQYNGATTWSACVCPDVPPGTVATITATYPARAIATASRVPGVAFQSTMVLPPVAFAAAGTGNPSICASLPPKTSVAMNSPPSGSGTTSAGNGSVPAGASTATAIPPTVTVAQGAEPTQVAPTLAAPPKSNKGLAGAALTPVYSAPAQVSVTGTPAEANVTWSRTGYANQYTVTRWKESDPNCCRATSPALPAASTSWSEPLQWAGTWMFRVTATFPDGSQQYTDARYVYPEPQIPTGFAAQQTAPGAVTLSWQPVRDASYYIVTGPPGDSAKRVDGTTALISGVPGGSQTWGVAAMYRSSTGLQARSTFANATLAVSSPSPSGATGTAATSQSGAATTSAPAATAQAQAAPTSGHYRVIANGFRAIHETSDDKLSRDGKGDEVYGAFTMFHYDRSTDALLDHDLRRTKVIGDINNLPGRIQGGRSSAAGGFQAGDIFPNVVNPSKRYSAPTSNSFPFLVWDGVLTDGLDAVILLPTMWEYDGDARGYAKWSQSELADAPRIYTDPIVQAAIAGTELGLIAPSGELITSYGPTFNTDLRFEVAIGAGVGGLFSADSYDRPIGVGEKFWSVPVLPRRAVVITREIIETALTRLAAPPSGPPPPSYLPLGFMSSLTNGGLPYGTLAIPLFDGNADDLKGQYVLYLQVERVP